MCGPASRCRERAWIARPYSVNIASSSSLVFASDGSRGWICEMVSAASFAWSTTTRALTAPDRYCCAQRSSEAMLSCAVEMNCLSVTEQVWASRASPQPPAWRASVAQRPAAERPRDRTAPLSGERPPHLDHPFRVDRRGLACDPGRGASPSAPARAGGGDRCTRRAPSRPSGRSTRPGRFGSLVARSTLERACGGACENIPDQPVARLSSAGCVEHARLQAAEARVVLEMEDEERADEGMAVREH